MIKPANCIDPELKLTSMEVVLTRKNDTEAYVVVWYETSDGLLNQMKIGTCDTAFLETKDESEAKKVFFSALDTVHRIFPNSPKADIKLKVTLNL